MLYRKVTLPKVTPPQCFHKEFVDSKGSPQSSTKYVYRDGFVEASVEHIFVERAFVMETG